MKKSRNSSICQMCVAFSRCYSRFAFLNSMEGGGLRAARETQCGNWSTYLTLYTSCRSLLREQFIQLLFPFVLKNNLIRNLFLLHGRRKIIPCLALGMLVTHPEYRLLIFRILVFQV